MPTLRKTFPPLTKLNPSLEIPIAYPHGATRIRCSGVFGPRPGARPPHPSVAVLRPIDGREELIGYGAADAEVVVPAGPARVVVRLREAADDSCVSVAVESIG